VGTSEGKVNGEGKGGEYGGVLMEVNMVYVETVLRRKERDEAE
jgi:hypothetical protein